MAAKIIKVPPGDVQVV